ncbi:hypothetical protein CIK06_07745 [Plantactinospora sp. KBS50]|nr:hypothetical protein CIK06_07745 [Plantactinospora sp. KBS50]
MTGYLFRYDRYAAGAARMATHPDTRPVLMRASAPCESASGATNAPIDTGGRAGVAPTPTGLG